MVKKILKWLIARLGGRKPSFLTSAWFLIAMWPLLVVAMAALLQMAEKELISDFAFLLLSAGLGVIVGIVFLFRVSEKNWPYILPHLSRDSIEKRVNEIET